MHQPDPGVAGSGFREMSRTSISTSSTLCIVRAGAARRVRRSIRQLGRLADSVLFGHRVTSRRWLTLTFA